MHAGALGLILGTTVLPEYDQKQLPNRAGTSSQKETIERKENSRSRRLPGTERKTPASYVTPDQNEARGTVRCDLTVPVVQFLPSEFLIFILYNASLFAK